MHTHHANIACLFFAWLGTATCFMPSFLAPSSLRLGSQGRGNVGQLRLSPAMHGPRRGVLLMKEGPGSEDSYLDGLSKRQRFESNAEKNFINKRAGKEYLNRLEAKTPRKILPIGGKNKETRTLYLSEIEKGKYRQRTFMGTEDKDIIKIALPAVLNNMIIPLVGAVDTFWVGRMGVALALAGQSSSNQVFSTTFWMISFLPNVITPLIAKAEAEGNREEVQRRVGEAVFIASVTGMLGMLLLVGIPDLMLNMVLPAGAPARVHAAPYLVMRGISYIPAAVAGVAFSAFRGVFDVVTPLKIAAATNIINMILDPFLIFTCGMGVAGAGLATAIAEILAVITYISVMIKKKMVTWKGMLTPPKMETLAPLLAAGASVQLRALVLQIAFVSVTRCVQAMDATGTAAAAHAVTVTIWQVAGIVLFGFGSAAGVLVPKALAKSRSEAVRLTDRLLTWGWLLGLALGAFQLMCTPLVNALSPLTAVQDAARTPAIIASAMQIISGAVFVGEGVMMGYQAWMPLAISSITACTGMMIVLHLYSTSLIGVWSSFCVFNSIRLIFVLAHVRKQKKLAESLRLKPTSP